MELNKLFVYRLIVAFKRSLSVASTLFLGHGLFRSMLSGAPVGRSGEPLPWFTYPAIEYLKQFDLSNMTIFEYGVGNSSRFWAQRAKQVVAVESDRQWFKRVSNMLLPNHHLSLETEKTDYVSSIGCIEQKYDIIVIDGRWRTACANACVDHLADPGMIILDNSDRYPEICKKYRDEGFFQIDFHGFGPINGYAWSTTIFVKGPMGLQNGYYDSQVVGGLNQLSNDED